MDMVLAILVLGAVIFFGALISAGNERQKQALDGIREQAALWAMQDLRLKREKLARDVKVDDPVTWLNQIVAKVYGEDLGLRVTQVFDNPQALICTGKDGQQIIFTPLFMDDISRIKRKRKGRLSKIGNSNPLLGLPRNAQNVEISILNAGLLFDLELPFVWKSMTGQDILQRNHLTMIQI